MRATENNIRARFICIFVNQSRYKNFQTHLCKENKNENKCSKGKQINKQKLEKTIAFTFIMLESENIICRKKTFVSFK